MAYQVQYDSRAVKEARNAIQWYARRSPDAARRFVLAIELAISAISDAPDSWPNYLSGTKVYGIRKYPYMVVYLFEKDAISIVAIAHGKRRPGYWRKRLRS